MVPPAEGLDPVTLSLLNAPVDDEPLTDEDLKALAEGDADVVSGRVVSLEQLAQDMGINLSEQP